MLHVMKNNHKQKNGSLCSPHKEISLSSPEEHDVGANPKYRQVTNLDITFHISKQLVIL